MAQNKEFFIHTSQTEKILYLSKAQNLRGEALSACPSTRSDWTNMWPSSTLWWNNTETSHNKTGRGLCLCRFCYGYGLFKCKISFAQQTVIWQSVK